MANADSAFGFVPTRHMSGNAPRTNKYTCASELAENIFKGDLCIIIATGLVTPHTATEVNNIGVFDGCSYTASDGSYVYSEYWPSGTAATDIILYIYDERTLYSKFNPQDLLHRLTLVIVLMLLLEQVRPQQVNLGLKLVELWPQVQLPVRSWLFTMHQKMLLVRMPSWKC